MTEHLLTNWKVGEKMSQNMFMLFSVLVYDLKIILCQYICLVCVFLCVGGNRLRETGCTGLGGWTSAQELWHEMTLDAMFVFPRRLTWREDKTRSELFNQYFTFFFFIPTNPVSLRSIETWFQINERYFNHLFPNVFGDSDGFRSSRLKQNKSDGKIFWWKSEDVIFFRKTPFWIMSEKRSIFLWETILNVWWTSVFLNIVPWCLGPSGAPRGIAGNIAHSTMTC